MQYYYDGISLLGGWKADNSILLPYTHNQKLLEKLNKAKEHPENNTDFIITTNEDICQGLPQNTYLFYDRKDFKLFLFKSNTRKIESLILHYNGQFTESTTIVRSKTIINKNIIAHLMEDCNFSVNFIDLKLDSIYNEENLRGVKNLYLNKLSSEAQLVYQINGKGL